MKKLTATVKAAVSDITNRLSWKRDLTSRLADLRKESAEVNERIVTRTSALIAARTEISRLQSYLSRHEDENTRQHYASVLADAKAQLSALEDAQAVDQERFSELRKKIAESRSEIDSSPDRTAILSAEWREATNGVASIQDRLTEFQEAEIKAKARLEELHSEVEACERSQSAALSPQAVAEAARQLLDAQRQTEEAEVLAANLGRAIETTRGNLDEAKRAVQRLHDEIWSAKMDDLLEELARVSRDVVQRLWSACVASGRASEGYRSLVGSALADKIPAPNDGLVEALRGELASELGLER